MQHSSLSAPHPYQHRDPQSSSPPPTLLVSDTSCLQQHLFSALKIPFYTFQEPSSHPLSRWQSTDEGSRVLESLFLACFSAACWNSEAGWVLHRQGSVALQKPFNPSPQFSSMPSLSSNKFVLNLLTASAFQGHTLHNLFPTKLQKANKRAKERGLNRQPEPQFILQSRCYFDQQMQKKKVDDSLSLVDPCHLQEILWNVTETQVYYSLSLRIILCNELFSNSDSPRSLVLISETTEPDYSVITKTNRASLSPALYIHVQASENDWHFLRNWKCYQN